MAVGRIGGAPILSLGRRQFRGRDQWQRCVSSASDEHVDTVVCGAGVIGSSVAYHLAQLGHAHSTLLLDLTGSDHPAAPPPPTNPDRVQSIGLVSCLQSRQLPSLLVGRSQQLYRRLAACGHELGVQHTGSVHVARCHQRLHHFRRLAAAARAQLQVLSVDDVLERCPWLSADGHPEAADPLVGGVWLPDDLCVCPTRLAAVFTDQAVKAGVRLVTAADVRGILTTADSGGGGSGGRTVVRGVQLSDDRVIACSRLVNAAGTCARRISQLPDKPVRLPVMSCEHYRMTTSAVQTWSGAAEAAPVVCDPDARITARVSSVDGSVVSAGYEPRCRPVLRPSDTADLDWDRLYEALLRRLLVLLPHVGDATVTAADVAAETFSADAHWTLGETGETEGYFVAAGFGEQGAAAAGGVGQLLASWIVDGCPPSADVHEMDVRRFLALHNNAEFLKRRMREVPGRCMRVPWPFAEFCSGRRLRTSPIFSRLKAAGARFGAVMGYERPSYFDPATTAATPASSSCAPSSPDDDDDDMTAARDFHVAHTDTFHCPRWFDRVRKEYAACRERVAISDYSSFTKIDLLSGGSGETLVRWLQRLCSNDVDIAVGNIVHTGMQNERGGYENDCSLARIAHNHYMVICPTVQHARCQWWLRSHAPADGSVVINDITSLYTALCVMGPLARELLAEVTDTDLEPRHFPFFTFKEIGVGMVSGVRAMNMTHTGELGWVLYVPNEFALYVYDLLVQRGENYGLSLAGYLAMRSLRVEKFYAFWGQDLGTTTTPLECGRAFRVKFAKNNDFIGREALQRQREQGVRRLYVHFTLQQHNPYTDPWPCGDEPILRDGRTVGLVTTSAFGYTLGSMVCLGFVQNLGRDVEDESRAARHEHQERASWERPANIISNEFVMRGNYHISIGNKLFAAKPCLVSPTLTGRVVSTTGGQQPQQQTRYQPTQHTSV